MNTPGQSPADRPLSGAAKLTLISAATAAIVLFYLFALVSVLVMSAVILAELVVLIALARFAASGLMAPTVARHGEILAIFFRSVWLKRGAEFRIRLERADAPGLYSAVENLCQKAQVAFPREISLEMNVNAWVRLRGYRRGAGTTILAVGYDLMAGLSEAEILGVLAHEITHAKQIQRGLSRSLNGGMARAARISRGLAVHVDAVQRAKKSCYLARLFLAGSDSLTRLAARLVAAYSRQDEFAADRGAAELCGADSIRSALLKLDSVGRGAARLPWRERVAQLQLKEGFSQWLVRELATMAAEHKPGNRQQLFYKYSTHPSLNDRLAALPVPATTVPDNTGPGINLLADPDQMAERLMIEIQRVVVAEEAKDRKALRRWTRRVGGRTHLRPLQSLAVFVILIGCLVVPLFWATRGMSVLLGLSIPVVVTVGVVLYRRGRYQDRVPVPVPDFSVIKEVWQKKRDVTEARVKEIENELKERMAKESGRRRKASLLVPEAYRALEQCDYVRAHVAARLVLQIRKKSIEGKMALAIGAAYLSQVQQSAAALNQIQRLAGLTRGSLAWGAGWAFLLYGDWARAEALLEEAVVSLWAEPTVVIMLALCQSRRGKLQSAIVNARRACTPQPRNKEHAKFLIDLLLEAGYFREAQERIAPLENEIATDPELMLAMVKLNLLHRNFEKAEVWTERLVKEPAGPHTFVWLGGIYEVARKNDRAGGFYSRALEGGHYPEACLGLGRIASQNRDLEQARRHFLDALNTTRSLGERAASPVHLFHAIIQQLILVEEPVPNCRAWIVTLNGNAAPTALANKSLMVYSPTQSDADRSLQQILAAMQPETPPVNPTNFKWLAAPKEKQPDVPVRPGVQFVLG